MVWFSYPPNRVVTLVVPREGSARSSLTCAAGRMSEPDPIKPSNKVALINVPLLLVMFLLLATFFSTTQTGGPARFWWFVLQGICLGEKFSPLRVNMYMYRSSHCPTRSP